MADPSVATSSTPWFAVAQSPQTSGQSLTSQRTALNEQTTGVANDLGGQNDDVVAALGTITTALNAKPAA